MVRSALFRALPAILSASLAFSQNRNVPKETLGPVLTPWEITPTVGDNDAFPSYKVIGNVYYVGTQDYASFLITSPEGHILINPDFDDSVDLIKASVEKLGFRFGDIKVILISHAHGDHAAGAAKMKEMTGAQFMVMDADVPATEHPASGRVGYPAARISRVLHDNDEVRMGSNTLVAHLTPGHTKGNTTWTMKTIENGRTLDVVIVGSAGVNSAPRLVNNAGYPNIVEDYQRTFRVLKALPCDVFLASHGKFYGMKQKYERLGQGANPFVDPDGYKAHVRLMEQAFYYKLDWAIRQ
jgi:metallo-beta-lactamase class B